MNNQPPRRVVQLQTNAQNSPHEAAEDSSIESVTAPPSPRCCTSPVPVKKSAEPVHDSQVSDENSALQGHPSEQMQQRSSARPGASKVLNVIWNSWIYLNVGKRRKAGTSSRYGATHTSTAASGAAPASAIV